MQDKNQPECTTSLRALGFNTFKVADMVRKHKRHGKEFTTGTNEPGRADVWAYRNGRAVMIEVKDSGDGIVFDQWEPQQREWAFKYCISAPYSTDYWLWWRVGLHPANRNPKKYMPRCTYLIHYYDMMRVEEILSPYQRTLPYRVRAHMLTPVQEQRLDAETLLAPLRIDWMGEGRWWIPISHPFHERYIAAPVIEPFTGVLASAS